MSTNFERVKSLKDLTIEVGEFKMTLNPNFLDRTKTWDNVDAIKEKFRVKFGVMETLKNTEDVQEMRVLDKKLEDIEYEIQELFKFPRDKNYHRFWERPHCACPKMDNQDNWGTGHYIINQSCPLHGS